jgi:quercetin dioxygenase-like cupin family protein
MSFHPGVPARLKKKRERVFVYSWGSEAAQLTYVRLEPGEETNHRHSSGQMGIVLKGVLEITIDGESRTCGPGDGYLIPASTPHGFRVAGAEAAECVEVLSPPKRESV